MEHQVAATLLDQRQAFLSVCLRGVQNNLSVYGSQSADATVGDLADHGQTATDKSLHVGLDHGFSNELALVKRARRKLEAGKYGLCEICGNPIADERLRAVPETPHCIECCGKLLKRARYS